MMDGRLFVLKPSWRRLSGLIAALATVMLPNGSLSAQTSAKPPEIFQKFFLEQPPTTADLERLPASAREVFVARVRIVGGPGSNVPMENSGRTKRLDKYFLQAKIKIVDVLSGSVNVQAPYYLTRLAVARPGQPASFMFPRTVSQLDREYYVMSFVDQDGERYLLGMPIDPSEYNQWRNTLR